MSRTLRIRLRAEVDIDEIMDWIGESDERAALRFQANVRETIDRIARFPQLSSELITPKGRQFRITAVKRYRRFVILFRLTEDEIQIMRVVRGMRNLDELLDQ